MNAPPTDHPLVKDMQHLTSISFVVQYLDRCDWGRTFPAQFARRGGMYVIRDHLRPKARGLRSPSSAQVYEIEPDTEEGDIWGYSLIAYIPIELANDVLVLGEC